MEWKNKSNRIAENLTLVIFFLIPTYLLKIKYGWFSVNMLELLIIAAVLIWVSSRLLRKDLRIRSWWFFEKKTYAFLISVILAGVILSILYNKNYYSGLGALKGWFVVPLLFSALYFDLIKRNRAIIKQSFRALFLSGSVTAFVGLGYWFSNNLTYDGRLKMFYNSPNELAMYLSVILLVSMALLLEARKRSEKVIIIFGIALLLVSLLLTFSFAAWAGAAVSLGVMAFLLAPRKLPVAVWIFAATLTLLLLSQTANEKINNLFLKNGRSSLDSRIQIWKSSGAMIKNSPIFGIGPANFQERYLEYQKYFPPYLEWAVPQPHNLFLAFWLEAGVLGLVGFIGLIIKFFKDNKKAIVNNRLAAALCASTIVYYLAHGLLDTTYWRNDMAILFWMFIALNFYLSGSKTGSAGE